MFSTGVRFFKITIQFGLIPLLFFITSCQPGQKNELPVPGREYSPESDLLEVKYAKGFSIRQYPNYKIIEVYNPWQGAEGVNFNYLLAAHDKDLSDSLLKHHIIVRTPVDRVICTSTTHIAFLESLQKTSSIVGVSGTGLITNQQVRDREAYGRMGGVDLVNVAGMTMIRKEQQENRRQG